MTFTPNVSVTGAVMSAVVVVRAVDELDAALHGHTRSGAEDVLAGPG
jgi:hypothetical protein